MSETEQITMVKEAIHNPDELRHFMRVKNVDKTVSASINGQEIARSNYVLKVQEAGHDLYDPVYYFPKKDVQMEALVRTEKSTHCPLKGDTEYFDINFADTTLENSAWHYSQPYSRSKMLQEHIGFDQSRIQIVEHIK